MRIIKRISKAAYFLLISSTLSVSALADTHSGNKAMQTVPASADGQVTMMNWSQAPYSRWAFKNTGIQPSVMVPRSGEIENLVYELDPAIADIQFTFQDKAYSVAEAMSADGTDAYIVMQDGKVVFEKYIGDFGEHDHHLWASSTKTLVAMSLGILVGEGKVNPDATVETYLSELKGGYFGQRTVRELLNMVSALNYSENYETFEPGSVSTEYFRRLGFIPAFDLAATDPKTSDTPRGILDYIPRFSGNPDLAPNHMFQYQSPNVDVIGWIIARVSGQALNKFIAENIWSKLGVEHDAFFMTDVAFTPVATGGFNTTLRDYARVGQMLLNNGSWNGEQIIPEKWIKDTFKLSENEREAMMRSPFKDPSSPIYDRWLNGYKNYLWVHDSEKGIATFRGVFGQILYVNQSKNLLVATFSSAASASNASRPSNRARMAAFEAIAENF